MIHFRHMMFVGLASLIGVFAMFLVDTSVFAQIPPGTMSGFAWSDASDQADQNNFPGGGAYGRGGGWISFDSDDFATLTPPWAPPSQSWSTTINPNTGVMTGYAYSSFLGATHSGGMNPVAMGNASGYIRFHGVGDTTPDGFVPAVMARLDIQNGQMEGWARACAVFQSGCSGALSDPLLRGGWDGWISLSGIAQNGQPYGVNMTSYDPITGVAVLDGYAWGDINLGWIFFDNVTVQLNPNPPQYCTGNIPSIPGGPHYFVPLGYSIDLSDSTLCVPDSVNPPIIPVPRMSITSTCYTGNTPSNITWAVSSATVVPNSCVISSSAVPIPPAAPDYSTIWLDNFPSSGSGTEGYTFPASITEDTQFLLSCQSLDTPSVTHSTPVTIGSACPANQAIVNISYQCTVDLTATINWSFANAVSCQTPSSAFPGSSLVPNLPTSSAIGSGSFTGDVGTVYSFECTGADGVTRVTRTSPIQSPQCSVGPGGSLIRPGFQEI